MVIIGVDTGGTFTDFIYRGPDGWAVHKQLSTPRNPSEAVLDGIRRITGSGDLRVVHGSTVATNAILEKKGARTALVTNTGFTDVIEIGRQNRSRLYRLDYRKNPALAPRDLRFGLSCRIDKNGEVMTDLPDSELESLADALMAADAESVAVSFLFSFQNPAHEKKVGERLKKAGIPFSLSHEILSEFREYERTSTTLINAYVAPKMEGYITRITAAVGSHRLRIMQSNGGSISAETARRESVRTILSGPAGGAVGAFEIGSASGHRRLISFDMGGTSTDVSLMDGALPLTLESSIDGYPVKVPMIDIHTVGAGGGSIASVDAGGSLKAGPESAGADPGPVCYGRGGRRITVTDANLFLGRLVPDRFLGGAMDLDAGPLPAHFEDMARRAKVSPVELAEGILAVANTAMERAIRVISVERGFDPRRFTLFSFGGAGGLHAVFLARLLHIPTVLVPENAGILSAIGMVMADVIKDYSQTVMKKTPDLAELKTLLDPLAKKGQEDLIREGIPPDRIRLEPYLDMRYHGQSYEIIVPFGDAFTEAFHGLHEKTYGYCSRSKGVEVVNVRLRARGTPEKPAFGVQEPAGKDPEAKAFLDERRAVFDGRKFATRVWVRDYLRCGNRIQGPAIITEYSATTVLPPGAVAEVDPHRNIVISVHAEAPS